MQNGCKAVDAWPAMYMDILPQPGGLDAIVCAKIGGLPFQNVTRPVTDSSGGTACPSKTYPCSTKTQPENTVCYTSPDSCPITDIQVVPVLDASTWTAANYTVVAFDEAVSIAYSKDADQLPVTSFKIEAQPCIDPYDQSADPL